MEKLESSKFTTIIKNVKINSDADLKVLDDIFSEYQSDFEDWTTNIRTLCRQCSEGTPHDHHDEELENDWCGDRELAIAVFEGENIEEIFQNWIELCEGKLCKS